MAVMNATDRAEVNAEFQRVLSDLREPLGAVTKHNVLAAVNAIDQWVSDNAASFNAALPQPTRAQLTASQKARLLVAVVTRRFKVGA